MTLEEIAKILSKLYNKMYVIHRDIKEASTVAKVYRNYIVELWDVDIKDSKNNLCILSAQGTGKRTDKNKDELVGSVERKFIKYPERRAMRDIK